MSKLDDLIQKLCPNGVEFKRLGDVLVIKNGRDYKEFGEGKYPVYGSGGVMTYIDHFAYDKPSVLIPRKGSIDKLYYTESPFWTVDTIFYTEIDTKQIIPRYVYYWLQKEHLENYNTAGGVPSLTQTVLKEIPIPVPPLPVQREIVQILDNFTLLTAELTAELTARKKQYEYYRDQLLRFDECQNITGGGNRENGWNLFQLGEIAKFVYGHTEKAQNCGNARFIRITDIGDNGCLRFDDVKYITLTEESKRYLLHRGDLLMARTGATYGKTLFVESDTPAVYASFLIKINLDNSKILNRFYWHFTKSTRYWEQAQKLVSTAGQPQFNANALREVMVPVPPLAEQARIVSLLDHFDALCNDLTSGLPAEIEARRKQYEYYRDKLLTFQEIES